MRWHRRQVLGGYLSLVTADAHVQACAHTGNATAQPRQGQSVRSALGMTSPIPRPPGVDDDDPDVIAGVYA